MSFVVGNAPSLILVRRPRSRPLNWHRSMGSGRAEAACAGSLPRVSSVLLPHHHDPHPHPRQLVPVRLHQHPSYYCCHRIAWNRFPTPLCLSKMLFLSKFLCGSRVSKNGQMDKTPNTDFDFFGMVALASFRPREYDPDLIRLEEVLGPASSSEPDSGIARFLPLGSLGGSLMINAAGVGGKVARRALQRPKVHIRQGHRAYKQGLTSCCFVWMRTLERSPYSYPCSTHAPTNTVRRSRWRRQSSYSLTSISCAHTHLLLGCLLWRRILLVFGCLDARARTTSAFGSVYVRRRRCGLWMRNGT